MSQREESENEALRAEIVEYHDAPNECTIFPRGVSEAERMTTWISAKEGSYVDLGSFESGTNGVVADVE